jgi:hypothetical protein
MIVSSGGVLSVPARIERILPPDMITVFLPEIHGIIFMGLEK